MIYIIVTIDWCKDRGISVPEHARKSIDKSKVILHKDFIDPILVKEDIIEAYEYDSNKLRDILSSNEWLNANE